MSERERYRTLGGYYLLVSHNYEKAIELQPDHMNAHYGLYNICARLKQQEAAKHHLAEFKRLQKLDEKRGSTQVLNSCQRGNDSLKTSEDIRASLAG